MNKILVQETILLQTIANFKQGKIVIQYHFRWNVNRLWTDKQQQENYLLEYTNMSLLCKYMNYQYFSIPKHCIFNQDISKQVIKGYCIRILTKNFWKNYMDQCITK